MRPAAFLTCGALLLAAAPSALVATGCRPGPSAGRATAPSASSASLDAARDGGSAAASADAGSSEELIGREGPPGTTDEAERANDAAFALHRKKKFAESRDGFAKAVALDPRFTMARYNLACALAQLGLLDDAAREVAAALREDLTSYRRGLDKDPDLAPLRDAAPYAARLAALVTHLEVVYRIAILRGLRATQWQKSKENRWGSNANQRVLAQPALLRVGVFDPKTRRFVPIAPAPPAGKALAAAWGRESPWAVVASGEWNPNCGGDVCQWIGSPGIDVYDESLSGQPVAKMSLRGAAGGVSIAAMPEGATLEVFRAFETKDEDNGTFVQTWTPGSGAKTKRYGFTGPRYEAHGERIEMNLVGPAGVETHRESAGVTWDKKARAVKLASGESFVVAATPADLPHKTKNDPRLVLSPNGRRVIALWDISDPCDEDHPGMLAKEAIQLIDLDAKRVVPLIEGEGRADGGFDPSGDAYVQMDDAMSRVRADFTLEPLPKGILLSPVTEHRWSCVGFW